MNIKSFVFVLLFIVVTSVSMYSQNGFPTYHQQMDFLFASPGAMKFGLYGFENPALLTYLHKPDFMFAWSDAIGRWSDFNRWGVFAAVPHVGFGLIHQKVGSLAVTDYRISVGFGDLEKSIGLGWGWSSGDAAIFNRSNVITLGTLYRPNRYLSIGAFGTIATEVDGKEAVLDLAVRPLGTELVALFGDFSLQQKQSLKQGNWSTGAVVEPLPGVRFTGRYFDTKAFTLGIVLSFGRFGIGTQAVYDQDKKYTHNTYSIRLGAFDRTLIGVFNKRNYVELNMVGELKYRRYRFFDKSNTLADLLAQIKAAKSDPNISGIAINTSGMRANREMLWEIREQLKDFKAGGKHVVIFIDRPNIDVYHFASIADKIVLDPTGLVFLEGYLMGRTFLKGTLEKLGIGFDEWRFFKYKSAIEILSRDKMSEADREQRQTLVNQFYRLAKSDICEARNMTPERFDQLVDEKIFFLPEDAVREGLADTLGRWETVKEIVKQLEGKEKSFVSGGSLAKFHLPNDHQWGKRPEIAVIYALGVCAMDEGINARSLVKDVEAATENTNVKAVILRVDSPGGDGMASDYIAEALKKCKEKKPVIISQGYVAASGGYWLSMYGDTIIAAPTTITGSIGVIGGWMYNMGLKETLGVSTDYVKVGKHADLGFGSTLPFLGIRIPDRNLTTEERLKVEQAFRTSYKEFVNKIASGRKKHYEEIETIAQGRVWSGYDGKQNGLVDVLGGLETAIHIAKERAKIPADQEVSIIEYPKPGLIDLSFLKPKLFGVTIEDDPVIEHLRFRLKHNGQPMPILPLEEMEFPPRY